MPVVTVSSKGWVVIPAPLRDKYDLKPGSQVVVVDYGGVLALVPALSDPVRDSAGILRRRPSLTKALLRERREARKHEG
jgi:AbrB family looped-hinge helix DNA binding protein